MEKDIREEAESLQSGDENKSFLDFSLENVEKMLGLETQEPREKVSVPMEEQGNPIIDENLTLEEKLARLDTGKEPKMKFNEDKATLEYADANLQKIHELRKRLYFSNRDPLADRQEAIKNGLSEINFEREDMGKTGDSRTGIVTEKHKKIAASQVEDAKAAIVRTRLAQGKKISR